MSGMPEAEDVESWMPNANNRRLSVYPNNCRIRVLPGFKDGFKVGSRVYSFRTSMVPTKPLNVRNKSALST